MNSCHSPIPAGRDRATRAIRASGWLLSFLILLLIPRSDAAGLTATGLRCEEAVEPLGVDSTAPRLRWVLEGRGRSRAQTAYQILVASSAERLEAGDSDLWDSGRVTSAEQTGIRYAGRPLDSNQTCHWQVRVWDERGTAGRWSAPARWAMGILRDADWRADWITVEGPLDGLPLFRREFSVSKPVRRARVHVSGLGHHEVRLDGRKIGDHFLEPPWSMYERTVYYATHDLTAVLKPGRHAVGVMLGKGFYNTRGDRRVHGVQADRPLKLRLQLHLEYVDGSGEVVGTDSTWKAQAGPITHSAILGGEDFDARRWPTGWDQTGFADDGWRPARIVDGPGGRLRAALSPPLAVHEKFSPVRIDEPEPGIFVYDFGQNASAIPELRVRGAAGRAVRMTPAEQRRGMSSRRNDGRGLVDQAGVGRPNYFEYTLRGHGEELWSPRFVYSGFQYLQVEGAVPAGHPNPNGLPVVEGLRSLHVRSAAAAVGRFECSDPLWNRIDRVIDWAVRANLSHVLTDCPHREKLGWLEVAYLMGPSIAGRYDLSRLYAKVSRDCQDSQAADGLVPTVAPAYPRFEGGFAFTPEWGAAAVIVPWQVHEWYGNRAVLEENYATMKGFVDYLRATSTNLVPRPGLGDWYDYGHGKPVGASQFTPVELSAMATFQRCAAIVARTAGRLGRTEDAQRYGELADRIREAFHRQFFDGTAEYRHYGSPQTANGMALALGLVPAGREGAVLDRLIDDLRRRGNQQTSGDVGHWYLLQALIGANRHDLIAAIVGRTNLGSYGFIVNNGWTSLPEAWDADTGASMNHCMLGHIQEWFFGWVGGIRPDPEAPGFRRFRIAPQPVADLTWARAEFQSVRGPIRSSWRRDGSRFRLELAVPANTTAEVTIPADEAGEVREGGRPAEEARGVRLLKREPGRVILEVDSGRYRFSSRLPGR